MRCPGQDSRYWKPDAIFEARCPKCGHEVEFFKDEATRACKSCGHRFLNPAMDFGCAAYCKFAEQCIGNLPPELIAQKKDLLKDRVAIEMKRFFKQDFKRIGHASRVARYAERIGKQEEGDLAVILSAAYLHNMGTAESATETGVDRGEAIARQILEDLGAPAGLTEAVCEIVARLGHPGEALDINFKSVFDADLLVNLEDRQKEDAIEQHELNESIERTFLTRTGAEMARELLTGGVS